MDLTKILSIAGRPGLYRVVSQLKNAVLVESLTDKKRFPAFAHEKISSMEEIGVFTTGEDKPLKDILKAFHEKLEGKPAIDPHSDEKALRDFFLEMVPDYDPERVYLSDIKKMISWYNLLLEHEILDFSEPEEEKKEEEGVKSEEEMKSEEGEVKREEGKEKSEKGRAKKEETADEKVKEKKPKAPKKSTGKEKE